MNYLKTFAGAGALALVCGCGQTDAAATSESAAKEPGAAADANAVDLSAAAAGLYQVDPGHGYITFTYSHQGYSHPFLHWRSWDAALNWNPENPEQSSISVKIDPSSIDTGVDKFDEHLKSADFFDVENNPEITFVSTGLTRTGPNAGAMTGDLTIKNTTRPVTLDLTINKAGFDERGGRHKLGFSGRASVMRSDFGVDLYAPFVGDEVDIIIEAEFNEQQDTQ